MSVLKVAWVLTFVLLSLSCDTDGVVGGSCRFGSTVCDHLCIDVSIDPDHCGACGQACSRRQECIAGTCIRRQGGRPGNTDDGGGLMTPWDGGGPDGGFLPGADGGPGTGGAGNGGSGGGSGAAGNTGGLGGNPCFPPYNSAERCGSCDTECEAQAPFCAPVADTFECVSGCEDPLVLCADRCVDTTRDPLHCGGCNRACPSGLCRDSECVGETSGHVVMMCISFEQVYSNSTQVTLLGNSVFLSNAELVRILVYERGASNNARTGARNALSWAAAARSRDYEIVVAQSAQNVVDNLSRANYDAFLMLDPKGTPAADLAALGGTLATTFDAFTKAGGTIILTNGAGTVAAADFLNDNGAGLLDVTGLHDVTYEELQNRAPADSVGLNVLTPFLALSSTCTYETPVMSGGDLNVVVTGIPEGETAEAPVVLHRVVPPQGP